MMELREKIAAIIYSAVAEVSNEPDLVETDKAADAILALPELKEALAYREALTVPGKLKITSGPPILAEASRATPDLTAD